MIFQKTHKILLILSLLLIHSFSLSAQDSGCNNENFELGTLDGWKSFIGFITTEGEVDVSTPNLSPFQHLITHTNLSPDPVASVCDLTIHRVAEGGNHSLRLGNKSSGGGAERVLKTFMVTPENVYFLVQYAVLLQDPGHQDHLQPRFEMRVFNEAGDLLPCGEYSVRANPDIPGFINCNGWEVLPWTSVGFELSEYVGQEISIELLTTDCGKGDHAGYAYIDTSCLPLNIGFESSVCIGEGTATLSVAEGFAEYLWSNGDTERITTIENAIVGDVISVELTSFTGCTITLSDTIEAPPSSLEIVLEPIEAPQICEGETIDIEVYGSNLETIFWKDLDIYANPISLTPITTTTYEIVPIDFNGCQHPPEVVTIVVNPPPSIEITASEDTICNGQMIELFLEVNNDGGFRWLDNEELPPVRTLQLNESTTFYAQADGIGTCPSTMDSLTIFVKDTQAILYTKTPDSVVCEGESITLSIEDRENIEAVYWQEADINQEAFSIEVSPTISRYFKMVLTPSDDCAEFEDSILVSLIPPLTSNILGENRCIDAPLVLDVSNESATGYLWQDGSTKADFLVTESGNYSVEITNDCETITESVQLEMSASTNCRFQIPSAFSPNGDGINDQLKIATNCFDRTLNHFTFKVFNRWGEVVFETNDIGQSWKGRNTKFQDLPNGLYVWWLSFEGENGGGDLCGQNVFEKGNVVLVR
ncbi:MAG: gliding motility-associated C-terminal domain-containing protein [Chitinophagales bacterium]